MPVGASHNGASWARRHEMSHEGSGTGEKGGGHSIPNAWARFVEYDRLNHCNVISVTSRILVTSHHRWCPWPMSDTMMKATFSQLYAYFWISDYFGRFPVLKSKMSEHDTYLIDYN